jgi:Flp pilus assembly protein TadG
VRAALDGIFAIFFCLFVLPLLICLGLLFYFTTYLLYKALR